MTERQWDLRNENAAGAYTRPSPLTNKCTVSADLDGVTVVFEDGPNVFVPMSSVSNIAHTK